MGACGARDGGFDGEIAVRRRGAEGGGAKAHDKWAAEQVAKRAVTARGLA
ncbi:MAG: hypothetical protein JW986_07570 [Methanotrichaceae archaeon]|nr:hypothetical protein [Methanotrichaceae archaeon]